MTAGSEFRKAFYEFLVDGKTLEAVNSVSLSLHEIEPIDNDDTGLHRATHSIDDFTIIEPANDDLSYITNTVEVPVDFISNTGLASYVALWWRGQGNDPLIIGWGDLAEPVEIDPGAAVMFDAFELEIRLMNLSQALELFGD